MAMAMAFETAAKQMWRTLGWICERVLTGRGGGDKRRQLHLVDSLALGNRRQLLLVDCGSQRYLVGAGADSVGSLLAVGPEGVTQEAVGTASSTASRPATGKASRPVPRRGAGMTKGPQLVRSAGQQTAAKPDSGAGLWR